jgi:hypothetical protein
MHMSIETMRDQVSIKPYFNNQFVRMHESIEDYSYSQDDIDDHSLYETDNYERMKPFTAKKNDVVGLSTVIPLDDNDEMLHFYDIQGESVYSNPPDPNMPTIDHGIEEDKIWAFRLSGNNQKAVLNQYSKDPFRAI